MASEKPAAGTVPDPDGRQVVLRARIWEDKISRDHPELVGHLDAVMETVAQPDHVEPDALPYRTRFYRRGSGQAAGLWRS